MTFFHRFSAAVAARRLTAGGLALLLGHAVAPGPVLGDQEQEAPSMLERQRTRLHRPRAAADGQGEARLDWKGKSEPAVESGTRTGLRFVFTVGRKGIQPGGAIYFYVPRYWGWSPPQVESPREPGFTRVQTMPPQRRLLKASYPKLRLLRLQVTGTEMSAGEKVFIHYGTGAGPAATDPFAEAEARFWFAVDGDGDGNPWLIQKPVAVRVTPGPAARLLLTWPSTARPGERVRLTAALVDAVGNAGTEEPAVVRLTSDPPLTGLPESIELAAADRGRKTIEVAPADEGTYRISAETDSGFAAESNALWVSPTAPRVLWADLQGHSAASDGTGSPQDYFEYARDVAALDAAALTDHDHQGWPLPEAYVDQNPDVWERNLEVADSFYQPGRFVTVYGYEWTSWVYGHRHVLYFDRPAEIFSAVDPRHDTPAELWQALEGRAALSLAHHSAGGPIATDWSFLPSPELEPVTEVLSIHGSSEAGDLPQAIHKPVEGNFIRDILDRGVRFGFLGSGDSHDGHPGLSHLSSTRGGGLAAIFASEATREGLLEALRARRVYATNGPRILVMASLAGEPPGSVLCVSDQCSAERPRVEPPLRLTLRVEAPAPLDRVEVVRGGEVTERIAAGGRRSLDAELSVESPVAGEYLYLRVLQVDGGLAIISPFFFD